MDQNTPIPVSETGYVEFHEVSGGATLRSCSEVGKPRGGEGRKTEMPTKPNRI